MYNTMKEKLTKLIKNKTVIVGIVAIVIIVSVLLFLYQRQLEQERTQIVLLGDQDITLEVGEKYEEKGFEASSKAKNMNDKVKVTSNLNTAVVGNYEVVYQLNVDSLSFHKTSVRTVQVKDTTKPKITIKGDKEMVHYLGDKFKVPNYQAIDNYDGDITDKVKVTSNVNETKLGTYRVSYNVSDSSGNETMATVKVTVKKKKNPYVVVSISKQTLKYYEYDKLVLTSNVVTGINGKTPKGTFKVQNKAQDIILKGEDYESFVSYWIGFYRGAFGFHDASWRSSFGGNIYKYAGSHGCVNMPYSKVRQLYNLIDVGTPVYIKS